MSNFKTPLVMASMPDGRTKRVHTKFAYGLIVVPAGFISDGASIPRIFWPIIGDPWGRYGKAAVLHDWLYQKQERYKKGLAYGTGPTDVPITLTSITRKEADDIFLEAMKILGVAPWRRNLMYAGVRVFGWLAWRKYTSRC